MGKQQKPKRRNALGKGLSALLNDSVDGETTRVAGLPTDPTGTVAEISIDHIETNPYQPRTHFDLVALEELSHSIQVQGIIQPITVRRMGHNQYQLISGERRFQASKMAGMKMIPAFVRTANDEQMLEMALIENIQRQDLNPIEIALAYQRLVEELNLRMEDLGDKVGKKRATVNNYTRLLKLPPQIQVGLRDQRISMGHARALIAIEKTETQLDIYSQILENDLSVRKVEELVRGLGLKPKKAKASTPANPKKDIFLQGIENQLEERFGSRVLVSQKLTGKGDIKISYESMEDLNRILEILNNH